MNAPSKIRPAGVPATVNEDPTVMAASIRFRELRDQWIMAETEIGQLQRAIFEGKQRREEAAASFDAAARLVVAGGEVHMDSLDLATELRSAQHRLAILQRAKVMAKENFDTAREEISLIVNRAAAHRHRAAVRRIARAVAELSDASAAEAAFRQELLAGGAVASEIVPAMAYPPGWVGSIDDQNSPSFTWMANAKRRGFIGEREDVRALDR
jgi:hypothetical protein